MSILNNLKDTVTDVADKVETAVGDSEVKDTITDVVESTTNSVVSSIDIGSIVSSLLAEYKTQLIVGGIIVGVFALVNISSFVMSIIALVK